MKTKRLVLFSIVCFSIFCFLGYNNHICAQDSTAKIDRFIEQSINNQVYIYDTLTRNIQNKNNYIDKIKESYHCEFRVGKFIPYDDIFDEIFSPERKKELKGTTLPLIFYCDASGNILEIKFKLKNISMISLQEINALEKAFLKYKINIIDTCPEKQYYTIMSVYHGWRK